MARSPARPSEMSMAAEAYAPRSAAMAVRGSGGDDAPRYLPHRRRAPTPGGRAIGAQQQAEGQADRPGDHEPGHPPWRPRGAHHPAVRHGAETAIETVTGPGVGRFSPPNTAIRHIRIVHRGRARTAPATHLRSPSAAPGSAGRSESGRAPLAARSDKFTRNAFLATVSGGSSREEMHPADDAVGGEHKIAIRGHLALRRQVRRRRMFGERLGNSTR